MDGLIKCVLCGLTDDALQQELMNRSVEGFKTLFAIDPQQCEANGHTFDGSKCSQCGEVTGIDLNQEKGSLMERITHASQCIRAAAGPVYCLETSLHEKRHLDTLREPLKDLFLQVLRVHRAGGNHELAVAFSVAVHFEPGFAYGECSFFSPARQMLVTQYIGPRFARRAYAWQWLTPP